MENALTSDSIRRKQAEIVGKIQHFETEIVRHKAILADLEATDRVIKMFGSETADLFTEHKPAREDNPVEQVGLATAIEGPSFNLANPFRHGTNKAFIWEVLNECETPWMNANQIQELASELKGEPIPMASISPMLSEMKGEFLERDNLLVALKSRLNENGEAVASPDAGGVAAPLDL